MNWSLLHGKSDILNCNYSKLCLIDYDNTNLASTRHVISPWMTFLEWLSHLKQLSRRDQLVTSNNVQCPFKVTNTNDLTQLTELYKMAIYIPLLDELTFAQSQIKGSKFNDIQSGWKMSRGVIKTPRFPQICLTCYIRFWNR